MTRFLKHCIYDLLRKGKKEVFLCRPLPQQNGHVTPIGDLSETEAIVQMAKQLLGCEESVTHDVMDGLTLTVMTKATRTIQTVDIVLIFTQNLNPKKAMVRRWHYGTLKPQM